MDSRDLVWKLLYTKSRAESWAELNLRRQGFSTLLPRVRSRSGLVPLYSRYLFVGHRQDQRTSTLGNTFGVQYIVSCGAASARVPVEIIAEIRARMDAEGVVHLDESPASNPLFAKRLRERQDAIARLVAAGFRVKAA